MWSADALHQNEGTSQQSPGGCNGYHVTDTAAAYSWRDIILLQWCYIADTTTSHYCNYITLLTAHQRIYWHEWHYITDTKSPYWHNITLLTCYITHTISPHHCNDITLLTVNHHLTDLSLYYSHNITTSLQWYHITDSKSSPYWQDIITSLWPWSDNYWHQTETASSHPHLHCVRLSASTNQNSVKLILNSFSLKTCQTDQQPHLRPTDGNRWWGETPRGWGQTPSGQDSSKNKEHKLLQRNGITRGSSRFTHMCTYSRSVFVCSD